MGLHPVALVVRLSKNSCRLRLRESTRVRLTDARWPAKPQAARREKTARLLLPPNRARFGQQSRTTAPKTPEKRAKKLALVKFQPSKPIRSSILQTRSV